MKEILLSPEELERILDRGVVKEYLKTLKEFGELIVLPNFVRHSSEKKTKGSNLKLIQSTNCHETYEKTNLKRREKKRVLDD